MIKELKYILINKTCKCGVIFETYNGGKKERKCCSKKCANSRTWSHEDKLKKSNTLKNTENENYLIEKICPSCEKKFDTKIKEKKEKIFCSVACGNKNRKYSEETKNKISDSLKTSNKFQEYTNNKANAYYSLINIEKRKEETKLNILKAEYHTLTFNRLKLRVLYEQDEKCNKCGLNEWMGEILTLELEHKDGNNKNNIRENLECLCPNCHSLTKTWKGRNKNNKRLKVGDKVLLDSLLKNNFNMRQSLLEVGLTPKGDNYKRCHRLKNSI